MRELLHRGGPSMRESVGTLWSVDSPEPVSNLRVRGKVVARAGSAVGNVHVRAPRQRTLRVAPDRRAGSHDRDPEVGRVARGRGSPRGDGIGSPPSRARRADRHGRRFLVPRVGWKAGPTRACRDGGSGRVQFGRTIFLVHQVSVHVSCGRTLPSRVGLVPSPRAGTFNASPEPLQWSPSWLRPSQGEDDRRPLAQKLRHTSAGASCTRDRAFHRHLGSRGGWPRAVRIRACAGSGLGDEVRTFHGHGDGAVFDHRHTRASPADARDATVISWRGRAGAGPGHVPRIRGGAQPLSRCSHHGRQLPPSPV